MSLPLGPAIATHINSVNSSNPNIVKHYSKCHQEKLTSAFDLQMHSQRSRIRAEKEAHEQEIPVLDFRHFCNFLEGYCAGQGVSLSLEAHLESQKKKAKKVANKVRQQDTQGMERFECAGNISINLAMDLDSDGYANIRIIHEVDHVPYCWISLPEEVRDYIKNNLTQKPTQRCTAKKLLVEVEVGKVGHHAVEKVDITAPEGMLVMAFAIPDMLMKWARNTNQGGYEVFALLGEAYGSGLPLGYLFVKKTGDPAPNAKTNILEQFLRHFQDKWNLQLKFTLSNKDPSEISAFCTMWPKAKHQLCFWHSAKVSPIVHLGGKVVTVLNYPTQSEDAAEEAEDVESESDDSQCKNRKSTDLLEQVRKEIADCETSIDTEDTPDWEFEDGEMKSKDVDYVFCPAPHRAAILQMFTLHFCWHPIFLAQLENIKMAEEIWHRAVMEMYMHCKRNRLTEVWAYTWNQWYQPDQWKLWVQSTSPLLSWLRTTMMVENHWKVLKHHYLHNLHWPRLDHALFIVFTNVIPAFMHQAETLKDRYRLGHAKALTTFQKAFKQAWQEKVMKEIQHPGKYAINTHKWQCEVWAEGGTAKRKRVAEESDSDGQGQGSKLQMDVIEVSELVDDEVVAGGREGTDKVEEEDDEEESGGAACITAYNGPAPMPTSVGHDYNTSPWFGGVTYNPIRSK
ncbi:hypothetical protein FRB99_006294 [Tulasnella sp. 403]|nr:hypothetical protein FRB99_006294 [Tulasnella sp. 403]